jgi:hypothetical protein
MEGVMTARRSLLAGLAAALVAGPAAADPMQDLLGRLLGGGGRDDWDEREERRWREREWRAEEEWRRRRWAERRRWEEEQRRREAERRRWYRQARRRDDDDDD